MATGATPYEEWDLRWRSKEAGGVQERSMVVYESFGRLSSSRRVRAEFGTVRIPAVGCRLLASNMGS